MMRLQIFEEYPKKSTNVVIEPIDETPRSS
jgi:hypothetical protein